MQDYWVFSQWNASYCLEDPPRVVWFIRGLSFLGLQRFYNSVETDFHSWKAESNANDSCPWKIKRIFSCVCQVGGGGGTDFHPVEKAVEEPDGLMSMGSHRVGHTWSNLAAAANLNQHFWLAICITDFGFAFGLVVISYLLLLLFSHQVVSNSFVTPWTVAHQAPLSMGFPRQEYWRSLPFPSPGDLPDSGIKLTSPAWQAGSLPLSYQGSPISY